MKSIYAIVALAAMAATFSIPAQSAPIQGTVILTKSSPTAVLLWDATARVFALANTEGSEQARIRLLEQDGVNVLHSRGDRIHANTMELRVVYLLHPVAAKYGKPSMADKGTILLLRAKTSDVREYAAQWLKELAAGRNPSGLAIQVQGQLPH